MIHTSTESRLHSIKAEPSYSEVTSPKQSELIKFSQPYLKQSLSAYAEAVQKFDHVSNSALFSELVCPYSVLEFRIRGKAYCDYLLKSQKNNLVLTKVYDEQSGNLSYFAGKAYNIQTFSYYTMKGWVTDLSWTVNDWGKGKISKDLSWASFIWSFASIVNEFKIDINRAFLTKVVGRFDVLLEPQIQESVAQIVASELKYYQEGRGVQESDNGQLTITGGTSMVRKQNVRQLSIKSFFCGKKQVHDGLRLYLLRDLMDIDRMDAFKKVMLDLLRNHYIEQDAFWTKLLEGGVTGPFKNLYTLARWYTWDTSPFPKNLLKLYDCLVRINCNYSIKKIIINQIEEQINY